MTRVRMTGLMACALLAGGCEGPMFEGTIFELQPARNTVWSKSGDASQQKTGPDANQLSEQIGALSRSIEVLDGRVSRLEAQQAGGSHSQDDIAALRRDIQMLRAERETLRRDITDDLAARVEKIAKQQAAAAPPPHAAVAPAAAPAAARAAGAGAPAARRSGYEHKVEKGQTLSEIARGYGKTVDAIMKANKIANPSAIRVGQVLFIPD